MACQVVPARLLQSSREGDYGSSTMSRGMGWSGMAWTRMARHGTHSKKQLVAIIMETHTYARTGIRTCTRTHAHTHARMHTRTHVHTRARMHTRTLHSIRFRCDVDAIIASIASIASIAIQFETVNTRGHTWDLRYPMGAHLGLSIYISFYLSTYLPIYYCEYVTVVVVAVVWWL